MDKFKPKCVRYRGELQSPFADCSSFPTVDFSKFDFPIKIIETPMDIHIEKEVFSAARRAGVIVEKDELLRALNHEREQFAAGYIAGLEAAQLKWTYIAVGLPKKPGKYLVESETGETYTCSFDPEIYRFWPHFAKSCVAYWTELPKRTERD